MSCRRADRFSRRPARAHRSESCGDRVSVARAPESSPPNRRDRLRAAEDRGGSQTRSARATSPDAWIVVAMVSVVPCSVPSHRTRCGKGNAANKASWAAKSNVADKTPPFLVASCLSTCQPSAAASKPWIGSPSGPSETGSPAGVEDDFSAGDREPRRERRDSPTGEAAGSPSSTAARCIAADLRAGRAVPRRHGSASNRPCLHSGQTWPRGPRRSRASAR